MKHTSADVSSKLVHRTVGQRPQLHLYALSIFCGLCMRKWATVTCCMFLTLPAAACPLLSGGLAYVPTRVVVGCTSNYHTEANSHTFVALLHILWLLILCGLAGALLLWGFSLATWTGT